MDFSLIEQLSVQHANERVRMNVIRMHISPINQLVKPHGHERLSK